MAIDGANGKKRKRTAESHVQTTVDTSKPTAVFTPTRGREYTLSIAIPGSIIANCQTHDQKTALAGQIARACAVFCVDEIIVFSDGQSHPPVKRQGSRDYSAEDTASGYTGFSNPDDFLYHVLCYLETPPHLRRALFPLHANLRTAGALPSLDMPHHMKAGEWCRFREGVTVEERKFGAANKSGTTLVECGLDVPASVKADIPANTRVTLDLGSDEAPSITHARTIDAEAVAPEMPRETSGYYWGYACRAASSLSTVFTECPFDGGYDACIGTSERGHSVQDLYDTEKPSAGFAQREWKHMVVVFGGVAGLEVALTADTDLQRKGVKDVAELFDAWINLVPGQGSRTIRTEEALWLGLMGLRGIVEQRGRV